MRIHHDPTDLVVEPRTFPYYKSDQAFTLVFRGQSQVSGATLPAYVAPSSTITPETRLWWNPAESGSGYALDVKHGVLVVTVYSYTAVGAPLWYLASGPIIDDTFTATLDQYAGGIACAYRPATLDGNDGQVTLRFHSPTSATMTCRGAGPSPWCRRIFSDGRWLWNSCSVGVRQDRGRRD